MNKGIGLLITIVIAIIFIFAGILMVSSIPTKEERENIIKQQESCEHNWVVTSKYDILWESFRTISKCSKCGKEV